MNNETLADILAEMRSGDTHGNNRIYTIPRYNPNTGHYDIEGVTLDELADRLEAAWKRERAALVAEAEAAKDARNRVAVRLREEYAETCKECKAKSGNATALRAALEGMYTASQQVFRNFARDVFAGERRLNPLEIAYDEAEAALAAPPRNCDRFRTKEDACEAYRHETEPDRQNADCYWPCIFDWLFAHAEGGAE